MNTTENILDNGALYLEPNGETLDLPPIELEHQLNEDIDWMPIKGIWFHTFTKNITHRKTTSSDSDLIMFQTIPKKNDFYFNLVFITVWIILILLTRDLFHLFLGILIVTTTLLRTYNPLISYFDKVKGLYWKRSKIPFRWLTHPKERFPIRLSDIRAIQLLENVANLNNSHELNMVLKNNQRILITAHQDDGFLLKDGEELARFIGVPFLTKKKG